MKKSYDSPIRAALKRLCLLLGLILTLLLGATLFTRSVMQQNSLSRIRDIPSVSLKLPQFNLKTFFTAKDNPKIGGFGSDITNILLVGQDSRSEDSIARSDSIILCTYNHKNNRLTLTSFLRDLYVPIPGYRSNRINAAYANGGLELLEETLESNFAVVIDGGVEVDFSQFSDIIDLMGGVELSLRQDEAEYINKETGSSLQEGTQLLNGSQALLYSRIRALDSDGDFSRTERQRKVLSTLMAHWKNAGTKELLTLTEALLPMIDTDISNIQLLSLAAEVFPQISQLEIVSQHVPASGSYSYETIDGMAVLKVDTEVVRAMLKETLLS